MLTVPRFLQTTEWSSASAIETALQLHESGNVAYAQPDLYVIGILDFSPDDPLFPNQFNLSNDRFPLIDLDVELAWEITRGDSNVVVAVIDDGIQNTHEDLDSNKFVAGWDFVGPSFKHLTPDNDPVPDALSFGAHGMCVSGIIAATHNNGIGIAGIAPLCKLMRLKFSDDMGNLPAPSPWPYVPANSLPSVCAEAIKYAARNGAHVINGSWGWQDASWSCITEAVNEAADSGLVMIFSAGNNGTTPVKFPARLAATNLSVLSVGAIQRDGSHFDYSNYGDITLVAPSAGFDLSPDGIYSLDLVGNGGYNPIFLRGMPNYEQ